MGMLGHLDAADGMTDNLSIFATRRSITVEAEHAETLRETLDRLRLEVQELHASRRRLALAADADRRMIERELHERVQQHFVAFAVKLQLAEQSLDADPQAAKALLTEMGRDIQQALEETAQLAQRIYPPLLDAAGLAAALRSAAANVGIRASVHVAAPATYPPEVAAAVYWSCLGVLEHAGAGARVTVTVREEEGAVAFEVVTDDPCSGAGLDRLRDRVEALGGRLAIRPEPGRGTGISGSLPLSR